MSHKTIIFPKEFNPKETVRACEPTENVANFRIMNLKSCPPEMVADAIILVAGEYGLNPEKPIQFQTIKTIIINSVLNN